MYEPVEMIAHHHMDGKISPLKLKVQTEDDKIVLKVLSSIEKEPNHHSGNRIRVFDCDVTDSTKHWTTEIIYETSTSIWKVKP